MIRFTLLILLTGCQFNSMPSIGTTAIPHSEQPDSATPLILSTPSPESGGPPTIAKVATFHLNTTTWCYGTTVTASGTQFKPNEKARLVLRHPITRERSSLENPEIYLIFSELPADKEGNITASFKMQKDYLSGLNGQRVSLIPGKYVAHLETIDGFTDISINVEIQDCQ